MRPQKRRARQGGESENGETGTTGHKKTVSHHSAQASLAHILSGSCAGNKGEARYFMRKLDKHAARSTARVERAAPNSKDTAAFLRRARAASLKAMGSRFGALAEEEYDKIAPVIACTLPAHTRTPYPKEGEGSSQER